MYYIERKEKKKTLVNYFFLRVIANAAPATANAAIPAIGAKSPVFAAFALVVVDSCPVCVPSTVLPLSVGVSAGVPSTATQPGSCGAAEQVHAFAVKNLRI